MGKLSAILVLLMAGASACSTAPPPPAPEGMVYVPGGTTRIGAEDGQPDERPVFKARVGPFFMDRHPVTVARFRAFVEATGYVTQAERFGDAAVFSITDRTWELRDSAYWAYPLGPRAAPAPDDHPVTQVSWNDAVAYAEWAGKRLPTEVEWEHAARGATDSPDPYAWGSSVVEDGTYRANVWNGRFPMFNTNADGYELTSPVGIFGESGLGLTDMGGNVWEWVQDWYRFYEHRDKPFQPSEASEKAQRGGSFLCEPGWCHGYRVSGRSHSTPESALFHVGFRCVKDIE
ncbi:MAG: formylglycine-generating enzyme family protein [Bacteroidota bacterium]|nr:formylglycine-generating enzyme family protein [Bacteroidota bacterium]MDE2957747.1 formylglycine-generating enzyme family protein [Bacteroidota bacterium]